LSGLGLGLSGYSKLGQWLLWAALPWAMLAIWCAISDSIAKRATQFAVMFTAALSLGGVLWLAAWFMHNNSVSPSRDNMQLEAANFVTGHSQLIPGRSLAINVSLRNNGSSPVYNMFRNYALAMVTGASDSTDKQMLSEFRTQCQKELAEVLNKQMKGDSVAPGHGVWNTIETKPLTAEQVVGIKTGQIRLYVLAFSRWRDSAQDLEVCQWLQPPGGIEVDQRNAVWHNCHL
jgi:hypothetical protein